MSVRTLDADTFTRSNTTASSTISTGWGTASGGSSWSLGTGSATFSIASNEGHVTNCTTLVFEKLGSISSANAEGLMRVKVSDTNVTAAGICLRATAGNTFYRARLNSNSGSLGIGIVKTVTGTSTNLFTASFTVSTATFYWLRFRIVGSNLYARTWADGSGEPGTWNVSGTDTSISGSGGFGLCTNSLQSSSTFDFDSFTVTDANTIVTAPVRLRLSAKRTKTAQVRVLLRALNTRTAQMRLRLTTGGGTHSQNVNLRLVLRSLRTRTAQLRFILALPVFSKNAQIRALISSKNSMSAQVRVLLRALNTQTAQIRAVISPARTKTAQIRFILASSSVPSGGFTLYANGTGTVSYDHFRATQYPDPSLTLGNVLPRLGSSNIAWNATIFNNTALSVSTSLDGVTFSSATSGTSITGIEGQPDFVSDLWLIDTSSNYIYTNIIGGSVATVTYDSPNSRITIAGGVGFLFLNKNIIDDNIDLFCDMDESDAGGLVWRMIDQSNYYELGCYDDSSSSGFTNTLRLYKVTSGSRSLLNSAAITWPRNTPNTSPYKRIRVNMLAGIINVSFDGTTLITYTDGSPFASGKCGLRNDGGTSRYYQLRIQEEGDYVSGTPQGDTVTGDFVYTKVSMSTTDPSVTPLLLDLTTSARSPQIETGAFITQLHDPSKPFAEYYHKEMDTLAQKSGDFYWTVSPDQYGNLASITFASRSTTPSPWCLHSSDLKFSPSGPVTSIVTPTFSADLYRNRQTITNTIGLVSVSNEQKVADGSASSWTMSYPVYSAPSLTVNGVAKTIGIQGVDTGKDFYWLSGSSTISQDTSAIKILAGYIINISYVGQFPDIVTRDNVPEQIARATIETGTSGIVEAFEDGKGMLSTDAVIYADGLLNRYNNNDTVELITTTIRSGLVKGMLISTFLPEHHLNNRQLLITKITTTAEEKSDGNVLYYYTIDATDGPNLSNWALALGL